MSVKALDAVFDYSKAQGAAYIVLIVMADWADHNGRCWPSFAQIAKKAHVTRATVATAIRDLIALGELERVSRGHRPATSDEDDDPLSVRSQWRNVYRILLIRPRRQVAQSLDHLPTREVVQQLDHQVVQLLDHPTPISTEHPQVAQSLDHLRTSPPITGSPIDSVQVVQSTHSHIRNKPSGDPSEELKAGAAPPLPSRKTENPDENLGVITKLVHETIDLFGAPCDLTDLAETVKRRCASLDIAYNSDVVSKAMASADYQRVCAGKRPADRGSSGAAAARLGVQL